MKKLFSITLMFFIAMATFAQGVPTVNSPNGYARYGYVEATKGRIDAIRDTSWTPTTYPVTVYYNGNFYTYKGVSLRWVGGSAAASLQAVTDVGNTTSNNATFNGVQIGRYTGESTNMTVGSISNALTSAFQFTAVGQGAGLANISGNRVTALGYHAAFSNTTAADNTAIGVGALSANQTGASNVAIGNSALSVGNVSLTNNVGIGYQVFQNASGTQNVAIGSGAMTSTGTPNSISYNVAIGGLALNQCIGSTQSNVAIGYLSMYNSQQGGASVGVGRSSLQNNVSGSSNVAVGNSALSGQSGSSATACVGVGVEAGINLTTASGVIAIGWRSGYNNSSGFDNIGIGYQGNYGTTTGSSNIGIGKNTLMSNTVGHSNTGIGIIALYANTTGLRNTALGDSALRTNTTGSQNIGIGYDVATNDNTSNGQLSIQNIIYGVSNTGTGATPSTGNIGIGVRNPTVKLDVDGAIRANGVIKLKAYTVATLPAGGVGDEAYVTDALTPTYGATAVGGGAVNARVFYNGTNWTTQ
jgi:hypothetical protein